LKNRVVQKPQFLNNNRLKTVKCGRRMAMRPGYILIILACLLPLCSCPLSFDDLEVIEWEVVEVERAGDVTLKDGYEAIRLYYKASKRLEGGSSKDYYRNFECTRPLNTNNLVYLNGSSLPGEGGWVYTQLWYDSKGRFVIYSKNPVETGDKFTFEGSWFFLRHIQYGLNNSPKYKVRIVTESITFEEDE
jgi:hypothetical protein